MLSRELRRSPGAGCSTGGGVLEVDDSRRPTGAGSSSRVGGDIPGRNVSDMAAGVPASTARPPPGYLSAPFWRRHAQTLAMGSARLLVQVQLRRPHAARRQGHGALGWEHHGHLATTTRWQVGRTPMVVRQSDRGHLASPAPPPRRGACVRFKLQLCGGRSMSARVRAGWKLCRLYAAQACPTSNPVVRKQSALLCQVVLGGAQWLSGDGRGFVQTGVKWHACSNRNAFSCHCSCHTGLIDQNGRPERLFPNFPSKYLCDRNSPANLTSHKSQVTSGWLDNGSERKERI